MSDSAFVDFGEPFYFEAVTAQSSAHTATAAEHNVEEGANVSDHVRPGLDTITLELFVSNTPLEDVNGQYSLSIESVELDVPVLKKSLAPTPGSLINAATSAIGDLLSGKPTYKAQVLKGDKMNVVKDIVTSLDEWRSKGVVGKVILPWKTYESMVITGISVKQMASTGDAAEFVVDFQEIRLVESLLVTAPVPTETRGKTMKAKGRQPTSVVREGRAPKPRDSVWFKATH